MGSIPISSTTSELVFLGSTENAGWRMTPGLTPTRRILATVPLDEGHGSQARQRPVAGPGVRGRRSQHGIEGARTAGGGQVGFSPPLMATMGVGKQTQIDALESLWDDAYWCLSRAEALDIVGYSFPADDLELRTLFRSGTRRAGRADLDDGVAVVAVNPSPDAHERARIFLGAGIGSDYRSADAWTPS